MRTPVALSDLFWRPRHGKAAARVDAVRRPPGKLSFESGSNDDESFPDSDYATGFDPDVDFDEDEPLAAKTPGIAASFLPTPRRSRSLQARAVLALCALAVMAASWRLTDLVMQGLRDDLPGGQATTPSGRGGEPPALVPRMSGTLHTPPPSAVTAAAPGTPAAPTLGAPGFELIADSGDKSDDMIVSDMARLLTPQGSAAPAIGFEAGWAAELAALGARPRLAIVTYDVLQAARQLHEPPAPQLQVVAPLFSEEVYFVVRADSKLRYIHEIEGAALNVGPSAGSRALTAGGIYQRMFGHSVKGAQADDATREEGLQQLLKGHGVDVLVLVGAQPDPWLAALDARTRQQLRVLQLDPMHPASRRATASFLPTRVEPGKGAGIEAPEGTRTLALMTFLVASPASVAASDGQILAAANAICRNLPGLAQSGHSKWREVVPGLVLDTGWPNSPVAASVLSDCPILKP